MLQNTLSKLQEPLPPADTFERWQEEWNLHKQLAFNALANLEEETILLISELSIPIAKSGFCKAAISLAKELVSNEDFSCENLYALSKKLVAFGYTDKALEITNHAISLSYQLDHRGKPDPNIFPSQLFEGLKLLRTIDPEFAIQTILDAIELKSILPLFAQSIFLRTLLLLLIEEQQFDAVIPHINAQLETAKKCFGPSAKDWVLQELSSYFVPEENLDEILSSVIYRAEQLQKELDPSIQTRCLFDMLFVSAHIKTESFDLTLLEQAIEMIPSLDDFRDKYFYTFLTAKIYILLGCQEKALELLDKIIAMAYPEDKVLLDNSSCLTINKIFLQLDRPEQSFTIYKRQFSNISPDDLDSQKDYVTATVDIAKFWARKSNAIEVLHILKDLSLYLQIPPSPSSLLSPDPEALPPRLYHPGILGIIEVAQVLIETGQLDAAITATTLPPNPFDQIYLCFRIHSWLVANNQCDAVALFANQAVASLEKFQPCQRELERYLVCIMNVSLLLYHAHEPYDATITIFFDLLNRMDLGKYNSDFITTDHIKDWDRRLMGEPDFGIIHRVLEAIYFELERFIISVPFSSALTMLDKIRPPKYKVCLLMAIAKFQKEAGMMDNAIIAAQQCLTLLEQENISLADVHSLYKARSLHPDYGNKSSDSDVSLFFFAPLQIFAQARDKTMFIRYFFHVRTLPSVCKHTFANIFELFSNDRDIIADVLTRIGQQTADHPLGWALNMFILNKVSTFLLQISRNVLAVDALNHMLKLLDEDASFLHQKRLDRHMQGISSFSYKKDMQKEDGYLLNHYTKILAMLFQVGNTDAANATVETCLDIMEVHGSLFLDFYFKISAILLQFSNIPKAIAVLEKALTHMNTSVRPKKSFFLSFGADYEQYKRSQKLLFLPARILWEAGEKEKGIEEALSAISILKHTVSISSDAKSMQNTYHTLAQVGLTLVKMGKAEEGQEVINEIEDPYIQDVTLNKIPYLLE